MSFIDTLCTLIYRLLEALADWLIGVSGYSATVGLGFDSISVIKGLSVVLKTATQVH